MKNTRAALLTAGVAAALITVNTVGAVFAFKGNDAVPSATSTATPAYTPSATPTASPAARADAGTPLSMDDAIARAGEFLKGAYLTDPATMDASAFEMEFDNDTVYSVSFIPQYYATISEEGSYDCFTIYVDQLTGEIVQHSRGSITVSDFTKIKLVPDGSEPVDYSVVPSTTENLKEYK